MVRYLFYFRVSACYIPKLMVKMRTGGMSNITIYSWLRGNRRDYLAMKRNRVPFPLVISMLKPLIKLGQFKRIRRRKG